MCIMQIIMFRVRGFTMTTLEVVDRYTPPPQKPILFLINPKSGKSVIGKIWMLKSSPTHFTQAAGER